MKTNTMLYNFAICTGLASMAFTGRDDIGIFFWMFVSFGLLVVVAQLVPAVLVIIGFMKGFPIKMKTVPDANDKMQ